MWTQKHAPTSLSDIVGHSDTIARLVSWTKEWENGKRQRPILLAGPAGVGKTAMARCLANDARWDCFELNASDTRDAPTLERLVGVAASSASLFGNRKMILLDEIDGLFSQDRGGLAVIARLLSENSCPFMLTANDVWDRKLSQIRGECEIIKVKRVHPMVCVQLLQKITERENVAVEKETLLAVARNAAGDVRCAVNDAQLICQGSESVPAQSAALALLSKRDREEDIFNCIRTVLKSRGFAESLRAIQELQEEPSLVLRWLEENVPKKLVDRSDLHVAFERLSRVDVFLSRVFRRQNFDFWRYATDLMAGVSLEARSHGGFVKYSFPAAMRRSETKAVRNTISAKIASKCHLSPHAAERDYMRLFYALARSQRDAANLSAQFGFDEEELAFLGASDPLHCLKMAEQIREQNIAKSLTKAAGLSVYS
ncbi:replication factor C large subunit [archaeon]|nr:replication factor C large subunit [archaeon]